MVTRLIEPLNIVDDRAGPALKRCRTCSIFIFPDAGAARRAGVPYGEQINQAAGDFCPADDPKKKTKGELMSKKAKENGFVFWNLEVNVEEPPTNNQGKYYSFAKAILKAPLDKWNRCLVPDKRAGELARAHLAKRFSGKFKLRTRIVVESDQTYFYWLRTAA